MAVSEPDSKSSGLLTVGVAGAASRLRMRLTGTGDCDAALRRMLAIGDAGSVLLALGAALALGGQPGRAKHLLWGLFALPLMVLLFKSYGLYDRDVKRIS